MNRDSNETPASEASALLESRKGRWLVTGLLFAVAAVAIWATGRIPKQNGHYGFWSLVPPLVAIPLAFWLQDVISALLVGIALGGVVVGDLNIADKFLIPAIGNEDFGMILVVLGSLGGLIGIWNRTGGAEHFAHWAGRRFVRGRRTAKLFAWIMGLVFHQGGMVSTVLTGTTARPLGDEHDVSHEEMAYIVDSTASPGATLIPFNAWPMYVGGLIAGTIPLVETNQEALQFYIEALPFNLYAIFAIALTFFFAIEKLPIAPSDEMNAAVDRARREGELDHPEADPMTSEELTEIEVPDSYQPGLADFFVPIGTLLGVTIGPYVYSYFYLGQTEKPTLLITEAFGLAATVALVLALAKGMRLETAIDGLVDGCRGMAIGTIILALALTLKKVTTTLGTGAYIVATVEGAVYAALLPAILIVLCIAIAFSTGTSWGTWAVVFPVAMPLAWNLQSDPFFVTLCFSAVVGGSVFGDQCSPISDTTILSSLATGCELMAHVRTQLPYAIVAGGSAAVSYTILAILFV